MCDFILVSMVLCFLCSFKKALKVSTPENYHCSEAVFSILQNTWLMSPSFKEAEAKFFTGFLLFTNDFKKHLDKHPSTCTTKTKKNQRWSQVFSL